MKRRLSVFLLVVMATFVFAGCSSNDPVKTTPEAVPATQVPNDADQGGGAGGTNDENNDGTPDSTPDPDERVEDGLDDRETYLDLRNDPPACDSEWELYT